MNVGNEQSQGTISGRRRRRVWFFAPLLLVLLVAVASGGVWHWRLALAERALPDVARSFGVELIAVSVDRLDFTGAELSGLQIGATGSQRIDGVKFDWTVPELFDRRLRTIEITGAEVQATMGPDGQIVFEGLPLEGGNRSTNGLVFPKNLPFNRISVAQSRFVLGLQDGQADVAVEGHLEVTPQAIAGEIATRYSAETDRGQGTGTGSASFSWAGNSAPRGEFELVFDRLVTADTTGTNIRLSGGTDSVPSRIEDLTFRASGFAEAIEGPGVTARDVDLAANLSGGVLEMRGDGMILDWAVALSARLNPFDLSIPAEAVVKVNGNAATVSDRLAQVSADGPLAIDIDAKIDRPAELFAARNAVLERPLLLADHVAARVNLEANLQRFALDDVLDTGAAAARVSATWGKGILDLDIAERAHIDGVTLAPTLEAKLLVWLPKVSPFAIALTEGMGSPFTVRLAATDGDLNMHAIGGIEVALPEGKIELEADGRVMATRQLGLGEVDVAALRAVLAAVPTAYGTVSGDILVTDLLGEGERIGGTVAGELAVVSASSRKFSARQLRVSLDGAVGSTAEELRVVLSPGGRIAGRDVRLKNGISLPGTTRLRFADRNNRLTINRRTGGISVDAELKPGAVKLRRAPRTLAIDYGVVSVSGAWPGRVSVDAKDVGAGLDAERHIELGELRLQADGKPSDATVKIAATDGELVVPGLTLPSFDSTGKIVRNGSSLDGEIEIVASGGQPSFRARGQHDLDSGTGKGEIVEALLRFAPGVLQPGDLSPAMGEAVENVFAAISLQGDLAWDPSGALTPNLALEITGLAAETDKFELFDASAKVQVTGLPQLATPPDQRFTGQVRVGRLEPIPLEVSFQLLPSQTKAGPQLVVEQLVAGLAEGRLTTDRFTLTPPSIDTDVTVRLEGADLARAMAVVDVAGVGGTGRISGEVPLVVRGDQVAISGGRLASDGPGQVFYDVAALPQTLTDRDDTVSLVLRALSNFDYEELQIDMDKALDGPGTLRMRLTGANPDVLESHPFIFNITLESNFDRLAALVLEGLTTSQGLLRALALSSGSGPGAVNPP